MAQAMDIPVFNTRVGIEFIKSHRDISEEDAVEIAEKFDITLNQVFATKPSTEDVKDIIDKKLNKVATEDFVRAEIQTVRTEIQISNNKLQWRLMGTMISLATICTMGLICGLPYMLHMILMTTH